VNGYDGLDDEQGYEEESFGRPFLGKIIRAEAVDGLKNDADEAAAAANRPYLLTGGRTGGGAAGIGIETIVGQHRLRHGPLQFP
jgi:hypothetical protein